MRHTVQTVRHASRKGSHSVHWVAVLRAPSRRKHRILAPYAAFRSLTRPFFIGGKNSLRRRADDPLGRRLSAKLSLSGAAHGVNRHAPQVGSRRHLPLFFCSALGLPVSGLREQTSPVPSSLSQMLRLVELAPAIQEQLLFLPKIISGRDRIHEHALRKITQIVDWEAQMKASKTLWHRRRWVEQLGFSYCSAGKR